MPQKKPQKPKKPLKKDTKPKAKAKAAKPVPQSAPPATVALPPPSALAVGLTPGAIEVSGTLKQMAAQAELLKVSDAASLNTAGTMLSQLKTLSTKLESERTAITKPLLDSKKRIDGLFKPVSDTLDRVDASLRLKVLAYQKEAAAAAEKTRLEELAKAEKAQEAGDVEAASTHALAAVEASTPMTRTNFNDVGSMQMKSSWTFKVVDLKAVPAEFFSLDESKIRQAIRAEVRDTREDGSVVEAEEREGVVYNSGIPGVVIYKKDSLAVSGS